MSQKFLNPVEVNGQVSAEYLDLSTTTTHTAGVGELVWNDTDGTMDIGLKGGNVKLQVGQEQLARVVNKTSPLINLLESDYQVVVITGATGQRLSVKLAQGNNDANSAGTLGVVTETINANQEGFITISGQVREINTTGSLQGETWSDGDLLFLSATTPGAITNIRPIAPNHTVNIGYVEYAHAIHGKIYVKVDNGYELGELHDVDTSESKTTPIDADNLLLQDSADLNVWKKLSWSNTKATLKTYFDTLYQSVLTNPITGTGTTNYLSKFTGTTSLGNSQIFDNGTNVGIGTTSPSERLEVQNGTSGAKIKVSNTGGGYASLECSSNATSVAQLSFTNQLSLIGGNVGIGTTSPNGKLASVANMAGWAGWFENQDATGVGSGLVVRAASNSGGFTFLLQKQDATSTFAVTGSGNVGVGTASPGIRFVNTGASNTSGPTLGSGTIGSQALLSANGLYGMYSGVSNSGDVWHQVQRNDANTSVYNLLLQPSGGNVGIGTSSPSNYSGYTTLSINNASSGGLIDLQNNGTSALRISADSSTQVSIYGATAVPMIFATNSSERMRITSSGAVGIGTSSPSGKFEIDASGSFNWGFPSTAVAKIGTKGTGGSLLISTPSLNSSYESGFAVDGTYTSGKSVINLSSFGVYSGGPYSSDIAFRTTSQTTMSEKMRITSEGNVGIGTSSPSGKLDVIGNLYTSGEFRIGASYAATGTGLIKSNSGVLSLFTWGDSTNIQIGGSDVIFKPEAGSERMRLTSAGNLGVGVSAPGYKTQIESSSSVVFLSKNTSSTSFNRSYFYNNSDVGIQIQAYGSAYPFGTTWPGGANSADITCNAVNGLAIGTSTASAFVLGTNSAERMRIDSSGNILVGQTSPIYSATNRANLTIGKSAGSIIVLGTSTAANGYLFYNNTDIELANSTSSGSVFFRTSGTERMRITSSGNVGIGTSSPSERLEVNGSIRLSDGNADGPQLKLASSGYSDWNLDNYNGSFRAYYGSSEYMRITSSGNVGIGITTPDASALLDLKSTTQGFLPPRMNDTEMNNISSPVDGLMVFNTDVNTICVYISSAGGWKRLLYA